MLRLKLLNVGPAKMCTVCQEYYFSLEKDFAAKLKFGTKIN